MHTHALADLHAPTRAGMTQRMHHSRGTGRANHKRAAAQPARMCTRARAHAHTQVCDDGTPSDISYLFHCNPMGGSGEPDLCVRMSLPSVSYPKRPVFGSALYPMRAWHPPCAQGPSVRPFSGAARPFSGAASALCCLQRTAPFCGHSPYASTMLPAVAMRLAPVLRSCAFTGSSPRHSSSMDPNHPVGCVRRVAFRGLDRLVQVQTLRGALHCSYGVRKEGQCRYIVEWSTV